MNASRTAKLHSVRHVAVLVVALLGVVGATAGGCLPPDAGGGGEGDRCNPALSHDECGSELACTQPTDCPENYCCPKSGNSTNPNCQAGCNGGATSIAIAGFYMTCSTSTPSPLCSCFNPPIFTLGSASWTLQVDGGPQCYCFAQQDPLACLATEAGSPSADGGGDSGAADAVGN